MSTIPLIYACSQKCCVFIFLSCIYQFHKLLLWKKLAKPCFHGFKQCVVYIMSAVMCLCQEKRENMDVGEPLPPLPSLETTEGTSQSLIQTSQTLRQQGIHSYTHTCTQTSTHQYRRAPVQRVTDTHRGASLVKPLTQLSISLSTSCLQTHTHTHKQQLSTCCCQEL